MAMQQNNYKFIVLCPLGPSTIEMVLPLNIKYKLRTDHGSGFL